MKNGFKKFILFLLLVLSAFCSSCTEELIPPENNILMEGKDDLLLSDNESESQAETPAEQSAPTVTFRYEHVSTLVSYVKASYYAWRNDIKWATTGERFTMIETVPWSADMDPPRQPNEQVIIQIPDYYAYTAVYASVYDWLESEERGSKQFLIRPGIGYQGDCVQYNNQEEFLVAWCAEYLPNGTVLEGLGYIQWEGTEEELLAIASYDNRIVVCFPDDFENIHGMSMEQARKLVVCGELGDWSSPTENSPLENLSPKEIAAYLADHPELLEE
ncbi:MAG: hypothetical protein IJY22_07920 [Clostridia bacterium]|nr:hypothetical protein [Clostridia bacterium]